MPNRPWFPGDDQHRSCYTHKRAPYRLSCGQFRLMLETAEYACEICGREDQKLHIDHDHDRPTRWPRGLVCSGCNKGLKCVDSKRHGHLPTRGITPREPTEAEQRYLSRAEERRLACWPPDAVS